MQCNAMQDPQYRSAAISCANELIIGALQHVPACIAYLARISDTSCFRFCAIPQIMAFGTLALCFNNADLFDMKQEEQEEEEEDQDQSQQKGTVIENINSDDNDNDKKKKKKKKKKSIAKWKPVKMRRGEVAKHMVCTKDMSYVLDAFEKYNGVIANKIICHNYTKVHF